MTHYTSIEESKKLLELGLSAESADMCYIKNSILVGIDVPFVKDKFSKQGDIPCWSLGALLEVMPKFIPFEDSESNPNHKHLGYNWKLTSKCLMYSTFILGDYNLCHKDYIQFYYKDSPIEAAYNMVVWLLENGYTKKGE